MNLISSGVLVIVISALLLSLNNLRGKEHFLIDGDGDDWALSEKNHEDSTGDSGVSGIDFGGLWIANDENYVYLRLEVGAEISLQIGNRLTLYLDSDANPETGKAVKELGLGAEMEWVFGQRKGHIFYEGKSRPVQHKEIGLVSSPSVTANEFEFALSRGVIADLGISLFSGPGFRLAFADESAGGDTLPDANNEASYTFNDISLPTIPNLSLDKRDSTHLRILSYNINSHLMEPHRVDAYRRIVQAVQPDIMIWEEVYGVSHSKSVDYITSRIFPKARGWYSAKAGGEEVLMLSSVPIKSFYSLGKSAAFLLDLTSRKGGQMLVVGLSLPCCNEHINRQREIDSITAFVREAKTPGGVIDIEPGTPIIYMGDANLVGPASQRISLKAGRIKNPAEFGEHHFPDWDNSTLIDLVPRHTHSRMAFTWYGDSFSPGRLDYVFYSDSVIDIGNRFVLFTPRIPKDILESQGLLAEDTNMGSHHLPIVADFILEKSVETQNP